MITLVTGLPGAAKTLYTLCMVKAWAEREKRPVFFSGISDLKLPWTELGPLENHCEWYTDSDGRKAARFKLPANALVVVDEAQREYRPRAAGRDVPPHVAALETHRHGGVDLVFITQHPMLVDTNVRRLTGRHLHVVRQFGLQRSTIHEWGELREDTARREGSVRHLFSFPREAFAWYRSADLHTVRRNVPMYVYVLGLLPFVLVAIGVVAWLKLSSPAREVQAKASSSSSSAPAAKAAAVKSVGDWVGERLVRVPEFPESAPVFDSLTAPKAFPVIAGCVRSATACKCYTQQGTPLENVTADACRTFVLVARFDPYRAPEAPQRAREPEVRKAPEAEPKRVQAAHVEPQREAPIDEQADAAIGTTANVRHHFPRQRRVNIDAA